MTGVGGHDLRMPVVGATAWLAGIAAYVADGRWLVPVLGLAAVGAVGGVLRRRMSLGQRRLLTAALLVGAAVLTSTLLRHEGTGGGPIAELAAQRASVEMTATVVSDPRPVAGSWEERVLVRLRVREVTSRDAAYRLGAPVLVFGDGAWRAVELGERVRVVGRLAPPDDPDLAAVVTGAREPVRVRGPDPWWRGAAAVRAAIRDAVEDRPPAQRQLVPALVVGDDAGMDPALQDDFRSTGLTHLTAVSGTNLTLLLGFVLLLARGAGVRRRWLQVVAVLGIVGFVLLTRTEPSVLRAAAMGLVGLFALGTDGRRRGLRALGVAVSALLLVSPSLAVSPGFALSVLATAGIVLVAPPITTALGRWLPTPVAQAVAVPLAAQVAVTPVVAGLSGEVSLVAVAANVAVAPAVAPATVLGLTGGLVGLVLPSLARLCGVLAGWCVGWIVLVAERGADLPVAAISWGEDGLALTLLVLLSLALLLVAPRLLRSPWSAGALVVVLALVVLDLPAQVARSATWPPPGWVVVACDVGQGDGLAVRVGAGAALVVDTGPEADPVAGCLDRLEVHTVPLVVLTHFHADHVAGLSGVLDGRRVGGVETSPLLDPPAAVEQVRAEAERAGVPVAPATYGAVRRVGEATVEVVWPDLPAPVPGSGDGSSANDASVVLLVETRGLRVLLTGDIEPPAQARLSVALPDLDVDVLKVPHHGSGQQDDAWLASLSPEIALVSAGEDNDYGHPAQEVLDALERSGALIGRTDHGGDLAVVIGGDGVPAVVAASR